MPKKPAMKEGQTISSSSRWWDIVGRTLAVGFIIVGALLLFRSHVSTSTASTSSPKTAQSTNLSQKSLPLIPESQWGKWYKANLGQSFPTTKSPFMQGQTIIVPNYVSIRVDNIARNWTPQPWQVSPPGAGGQDNATGKEVILVRFTIKNLSTVPLMYSDSYFSLVRANGHEQRVAELDELTGDQYGSFGQTSPWLHPGAIVHTFVPFLVNPGEKPGQFVLTWRTVDPTRPIQSQPRMAPRHSLPTRILTAQKDLNNPNDQQQEAQEQLKKDIVAHFTTLPTPTASEVYTYYVQHISSFARTAPQMHVQQIVMSSLQTAEQAVNQLKQGTPFSTIEASYDMSGAYYTAHGGDLGWITLGPGFPPEWTAQVGLLQPGQITAPFLVDSNYYIVKCIEGPDYDAWPFSQVQGQAHADLLSAQLDTVFAHILVQQERTMNLALLNP